MKLRNKMTGEIGEFMGTYNAVPFIGIGIDYHDGNPVKYEYNTLTELNEEWEDVKPTEPLINDELARKTVKSWYSRNNIIGKLCSYGGESWLGLRGSDEGGSNWKIELRVYYNSLLKDDELYSLTELCGDEEE